MLPICASVALACGDNGDPQACSDEIPSGVTVVGADCESAWRLAKRTSPNLVLSQDEIDWHLAVYVRGYNALRDVLGRPPIAMDWYGSVGVRTSRPELVAAWSQGNPDTGIAELDNLLHSASVGEVTGHAGGSQFTFRSGRVLVERTFADALIALAVPGLEVFDPYVRLPEYRQEVVIEPAQDTSQLATLVFSIGWGDCLVDCIGQHFWRVGVTADSSSLLDEWGDLIPDDVRTEWQ